MAKERASNIKLGAFVLTGTAVLLLGLYILGSKRDLFSRNMDITATFHEVNGLRRGNNVRYAGIDVGTVKDIEILNDTTLLVHMVLRLSAAEHIRTNAVARIGSDGLMGNKLVSIEPGEGPGEAIADGAQLRVGEALDTDAMLRTLGRSNDNLVAITTDLRELTRRISADNGLLTLLGDTSLVTDVRMAVHDVRASAGNARGITESIEEAARDLEAGRGALGALTRDPAVEQQVRGIVAQLQATTESLHAIAAGVDHFLAGLEDPKGLGYTLTRDTAAAGDVRRVLARLDTGSVLLNEDLRALQRNWFFRRYFKEREKGN